MRLFISEIEAELIKCKKQLKRVDLDILERLISNLYQSGMEKKSIIARNSKMSYDNCVLYLEVLEMMDFVKRENNEDGHELLGLTHAGISFYKRKMNQTGESGLQIKGNPLC